MHPFQSLARLVVIAACGAASAAWAVVLPAQEAQPAAEISTLASLLELVIDADAESARSCLQKIAERIRTSELDPATIAALKQRLGGTLGKFVADAKSPLHQDAILLAALWSDEAAGQAVAELAGRSGAPVEQRQLALATLVSAKHPAATRIAANLLARRDDASRPLQLAVITALARADDPAVAAAVLDNYDALAADSQAAAIELLTRRAVWARPLVAQIAERKIPPQALNVNHARKLLSFGDDEITSAVTRLWGTIREGRDPAREQVVVEMRRLIANGPIDAHRGNAVFNKVCAQCHKIYGQGQEVGPDLTSNGRASREQLLSNVFDPSLVIGVAYQARTVRTTDGRIITGLLVEDNEQRVILKLQGGKLETIARGEVDAMKISELSLMPEGLEKQLQPQEIADLFAFLSLDKHPSDPLARQIPSGSR